MKNSFIHVGLTNKEVRDFLSISLVKNFEEECNLIKEKEVINHKDCEDTNDWLIKTKYNGIKSLQKEIELLKHRQAIYDIINNNGWKEYDVSDDTEKDLEYKLHMSFIGTKTEYDILIQIINLEK